MPGGEILVETESLIATYLLTYLLVYSMLAVSLPVMAFAVFVVLV